MMTRNEVTAAHECNGRRTTTVEVMASAGKMAALRNYSGGLPQQNPPSLLQVTKTTTTTQVTTSITINRLKEMAEEQHHRNLQLQGSNCQLTSQLKQAQNQIEEMKKAIKTERLAYSDMKSKQSRLDKHIEAFNGILQGIDITHLKLSTAMNACQTQQEEFSTSLKKSLDGHDKLSALQKRTLSQYSGLDSRAAAMSSDVNDAKNENKKISNELVKCKALISEKSKQLEDAQKQLEELRVGQVKLKSDLSLANAKYDADMKKCSMDQEVLKQELSRTVNSLNGYLETRQREADQKAEAQKLLKIEKAKVASMTKATHKILIEFTAGIKNAEENQEKSRESRFSKWDSVLLSCNQRISKVSEVLLKIREKSQTQQKDLKVKEDTIKTINLEKDELAVRVTSLSSNLDSTQSKLVMKTSEAEIATKEGKEMQKQLKSLKEEQKQYCIALSNQNASELNKMKEKMREEVEAAKGKLRAELEERESNHGVLKGKHDVLEESLMKTRRELDEFQKNAEEEMKRSKVSYEGKLKDQMIRYESKINALESSLARVNEKSAQLEEDLANASAARDKAQQLEEELQQMKEEQRNIRAGRNAPSGQVATEAPPIKSPANMKRRQKKSSSKVRAVESPPATTLPKPSSKAKNKRNSKAGRKIARKAAEPKEIIPSKLRNDFDDLFEDSLLDPYSF